MCQTVKSLLVFAAIAAMTTGLQSDRAGPQGRRLVGSSEQGTMAAANRAQLPYYPQDVGLAPQAPSLNYPFQLVSLGNGTEPGSYFDAQQYALFGSMLPMTGPHQRALLEPAEKPKSLAAPHRLTPRIARIHFRATVLPPMAHSLFCLHYPKECKVHKIVFRGGPIKLTASRRAELMRINNDVNHRIIPEANTEGLAGEKWLISPKSGDCNDYAVTKRHELLARGWPARVLLLSEVVTSWGEHHLVLLVRTSEGDVVADNLSAQLRSWSKTPYQWVRIQSPNSPLYWSSVDRGAA